MLIANTTDSHKATSSFTQRRPRGASFGLDDVDLPPIESIATDKYDARLAYVMSVISAWAYADERALAEKLRYYGIEGSRVRRIAVQNDALLIVATAYFVQSASGRVGVLAFRGTDPASLVTILADAEVMPRPFLGGAVHSGFYANVEAVWDDVTECLDAALHKEHVEDAHGKRSGLEQPLETLYITGHSLGGAMAVLAAARLFGGGLDANWRPAEMVKGVYTFGQPMVGDRAFANKCRSMFGDRLFRHVYRHDVVPHLPPTSELKFEHTGLQRHAGSVDDSWKEGQPASPRASFAGALLEVGFNALETRLFPMRTPGYSIDDHMPSNYLNVSRYSLAPTSVADAAARRSLISPLAEIPHDVGLAVRRFLKKSDGENGGSKDTQPDRTS
jgi:hypothetical protein